jgi:phenylalanyl-tRNA synthetase alpha chain
VDFQKNFGDIDAVQTLKELERLKLSILGRQGWLTEKMSALRQLSGEEKAKEGKRLNLFKQEISQKLEERREFLKALEEEKAFQGSSQDSTIPVPGLPQGYLHPLMETIEEVSSIFGNMGFKREDGPEIEEDSYNFTALRIPPHHPARDTQDTFYFPQVDSGVPPHMLRSQTSPGQIRIMENTEPPFRVIIPGRVYRVDDWDATHVPMFHQIEGLLVEKNITMGHLKGCLQDMMNRFFKREVDLRFRPSFFPFTEPSAEVDLLFEQKNEGNKPSERWLEVLGCGMVHPEILERCHIDPKVYQGFAFGMGVERLTMLKYGIHDLRHFFENDQRWLSYYGHEPWR